MQIKRHISGWLAGAALMCVTLGAASAQETDPNCPNQSAEDLTMIRTMTAALDRTAGTFNSMTPQQAAEVKRTYQIRIKETLAGLDRVIEREPRCEPLLGMREAALKVVRTLELKLDVEPNAR